MFRAQQNAFDDAIAKATDENLTSENWELILDVCDRVTGDESGARDATASLIKRLAHRNANVQLYTLELANALSQNCGVKMHTELASRSFTDALLRLANDRNTHQQVKTKILERMGEWAEMFSKDPGLGIMEQAYMKLKTQNPNLHPPSKPTKRQITDVDRAKEEEELQMALALSIKDKAAATQSSSKQSSNQEAPSQVASSSQQKAPSQPVPSGTTAATVSRVRALYDFQPSEPGELQFRKGDIIAVLESVYKDWWKGSLRGNTGIFPLNYVEKLADPTQDELQREAQMEAEVFGQIKNVEKLLALLSTSNPESSVRDNEEITELYHSTLAIRPKLIELIGKYSQRKDDFTQLNEKFIKARRDYESLLEASMAQPPQQYGRPGQVQPPFGYPPQAAPPQQGPGRFYTPVPQGPQGRQTTPQPQNIPQNGPMPYIYGNAPTSQRLQYPPNDQRNRIPSGGGQPPPQQQQQQQQPPSDPYGHRPQSTYDHPQELGTSSYHNTPTTDNHPTQPHPNHAPSSTGYPAAAQHAISHQGNPSNEYSPSVYSPDDPIPKPQGFPPNHPQSQVPHQQQQQQQQNQPPYPPSAQIPSSQQQQRHSSYAGPPPQQPSHAPPSAPSPNLNHHQHPQHQQQQQNNNNNNPYPVLNSGAPPGVLQPGGGAPYHAYQAAPPSTAGAGGGGPDDFYR